MKTPVKTPIHPGQKISAPKKRIPPMSWLSSVTAVVNAVLKTTAVEIDTSGNETGKKTVPTITEDGGLKIKIPASSGGGSDSAGSEKGEWSATYPGGYPIYSKVVLRGGALAGYYMSLADNNTSEPGSSSTWLMLAPGDTVGSW